VQHSQATGITVLHSGKFKNRSLANKNIHTLSVLIIHVRRGILGVQTIKKKNANPLSQAPPVRGKFAVVARIFPG
jgi:hypothetical protein